MVGGFWEKLCRMIEDGILNYSSNCFICPTIVCVSEWVQGRVRERGKKKKRETEREIVSRKQVRCNTLVLEIDTQLKSREREYVCVHLNYFSRRCHFSQHQQMLQCEAGNDQQCWCEVSDMAWHDRIGLGYGILPYDLSFHPGIWLSTGKVAWSARPTPMSFSPRMSTVTSK